MMTPPMSVVKGVKTPSSPAAAPASPSAPIAAKPFDDVEKTGANGQCVIL